MAVGMRSVLRGLIGVELSTEKKSEGDPDVYSLHIGLFCA